LLFASFVDVAGFAHVVPKAAAGGRAPTPLQFPLK
jgi:hypothetical protein